MIRPTLSPAALALLRALIRRANLDQNRVLLSDCASVDWQSLTFSGERHVLTLKIIGPDSAVLIGRLTSGVEDAELWTPGHVVADVAISRPQETRPDGSTEVTIEALTICESV